MNQVKSDNPSYVFVAPGVLKNVDLDARKKFEAYQRTNQRLDSLEADISEIKYLLKTLINRQGN